MTIKTKIMLNMIFIILISIFLGYVGTSNMRHIDESYNNLWRNYGESFVHLGKAQATFHQYRLNLRTLVLIEDTKEAEATLKKLETRLAENAQAIALVGKTILNENEKSIFDSIKTSVEDSDKTNAEVIALVKAGKNKEARSLLLGEGEKKAQTAKNFIEGLVKLKTGDGNNIAAGNSKDAVNTENHFYFIVGAIILFSIAFGYFICMGTAKAIRSIIDECQKLTQAAVEEKFETRGDVNAMSLEFKPVLEGMNKTLDKVVEKIHWYEQLLDAIPFPISVTDNNIQWTFFNKPVEEFLGAKRKDMLGYSSSSEGLGKSIAEHTGKIYQIDNFTIIDTKGEKCGNIELLFDITAKTKGVEYLKREVDRVSNSLTLIAAGDFNISDKNEEPDEYTEKEHELLTWLNISLFEVRNSILKLSSDTKELVFAALDGKLDVRANESEHNGEFRKIIEGINNTLDAATNPIKEAAGCLEKMAKGDLDTAVTGDYKGDHAIIKNALNQTIDSMNEILNQVLMAVDQVNTGARQVSDASQSLSQGASESASSLEEISSSMHEINSQTKHNSENASQADLLAKETSHTAESGYAQVIEMTAAMNEINDAAANVSKIIKSIDEIAFQTNLLALNAAVEAARAGKHGKGFTVVAEEVRNLAQRSAKAAKETSEMIENSIKKTTAGTKIADSTSKALEEIVRRVTKVTDLVGEIASSSKEQTQGIMQVNQGLGQVDQVTQQNTATAEESAAASEELSSQAGELKALLAKFKLKGGQAGVVTAYVKSGNQTAKPAQAQFIKEDRTRPAGIKHAQITSGKSAVHENQTAASSGGMKTVKIGTSKQQPQSKNTHGEKRSSEKINPEDIISLDDKDFGKF